MVLSTGFQCIIFGAILFSTKFNVNVGAYEEPKYPGLARKFVKQNSKKEKERQHPPTHQGKYGSHRSFLIVQ